MPDWVLGVLPTYITAAPCGLFRRGSLITEGSPEVAFDILTLH